MNFSEITGYLVEVINLILLSSLPPVIVAAAIGVIISLIQALTQVQEQTLSFGFKLIGVIITLVVMIEGIGKQFFDFTQHIFDKAATWTF